MKRWFLISLILLLSTTNAIAKGVDSDTAEQINQINDSFNSADDSALNEEDIQNMGYGIDPADKKRDLTKKYASIDETDEQNAVTLNLNQQTGEEKFEERSNKIFKLGVEKESPYADIEASNMFWDNSKNFTNVFFQDYKNLMFMPSTINSSVLKRDLGAGTSVYVGQEALSSFDGVTVDFIRSNITTYDVGAKIIQQGDKVKFSAGTYTSTLNQLLSGGAVLSSNSINLPKNLGSFLVGGGFYSNEYDAASKNTGGLFAQYKFDRLKLNASVSKSQYSNADNLETGIYLVPELQLTKSVSLKTRVVKNISQNTNQGEIGLTYKPWKNNSRDFELELNAANTHSPSQVDKQRFKFSASFKL
ncbi:MAG: hypothetical protein PHV37_07525 [Candidatus Gastranaerophilales bacterium]|nr:hypothetical protein [Candidatus Gastranaerophilales bacterium]